VIFDISAQAAIFDISTQTMILQPVPNSSAKE